MRTEIEHRLDQGRGVLENPNKRQNPTEICRSNVVFNVGASETAVLAVNDNEIDARKRHYIGRCRIEGRDEDAERLPPLRHDLNETRSRDYAGH